MYTNKSDNEDDSNDDVEDIDPGDKLVDYLNNGNNYNDDDDNMMKKMIMITIGTAVMTTICTVMPLKEGDSLF